MTPEESLAKQRIIYDQTVRSADRQATILSEARSRASIVMSASGVVATIFAVQTLGNRDAWPLAIPALILTGLGLSSCIGVLWPVKDKGTDPGSGGEPLKGISAFGARKWKVTLTADDIRGLPDGDEATVLADVSAKLSLFRKVNNRSNRRNTFLLMTASLLLVAQVGLWAASLMVYAEPAILHRVNSNGSHRFIPMHCREGRDVSNAPKGSPSQAGHYKEPEGNSWHVRSVPRSMPQRCGLAGLGSTFSLHS